MTFTIEFSRAAAKAMAALDPPIASRIGAAVEGLSVNPRPMGFKLLKGGDGLYRVRVGDYRIVYCIHDGRLVVLVVDVRHRREVYR